MCVTLTCAVTHQSARCGVLGPAKHRRQSVRESEVGETDTVRHRRAFGKDDHRVRPRLSRRVERLIEFRAHSKGRLREGNVAQTDSEARSRCFGGLQLALLPWMVSIR